MLAGVLWGTTGTAQALSGYPGSSLGLGAARTAITAALLVAVVSGTHGRTAFATLRRPGTFPIVLLGAAGMAGYQLCFFAATGSTGVAVGTLTAIGSAPILAGVLALVLGVRPGLGWLAATTVALAGLCLLVVPSGGDAVRPAGVVAGLGAGTAYAGYTWCSRRLLDAGVPPTVLLAALFAGATVLTAPLGWRSAVTWLADPDGLVVVGYLAVVATVLPYSIWIRGMATTVPAVATTLTLTEPLTATLLAVFLLGERLDQVTLAGASLIAVGLLLTVLSTLRGDRRADRVTMTGESP
jgi:DME family drug/metabolite transporter